MASPTRRLPKAQRRATLVSAASELFARRGYEHASLDELAAQAGVTKPIVYRHFASKQALYLELLTSHRDALLSTLAEGMATPGPLAERIPLAADLWFAYVEAHPFAWAMLFNDVTGDPEIRAVHATMRETARNAVAGLLRADGETGLADDLLVPVAEVLRSAMTGLATWWLDHPDVPRSTLVRAITQTTGRGLVVSAREASTGPHS
jgi:AcrR family transcriptional regulator